MSGDLSGDVREIGRLVPREVEARAKSYKRFGVAFGDRFFMLLFVGLVWLGPAFVDLRFVYALLAWDLLVVLAWAVDLARLPKPEQLTVRRSWRSPAALSIGSDVDVTVENSSRTGVLVSIVDSVPLQLRSEPPTLAIRAGAKGEGTASLSHSSGGAWRREAWRRLCAVSKWVAYCRALGSGFACADGADLSEPG